MTTAPSERDTMSWLKIISGRGRDGRCDVMEAGSHVGTQGDMYRLCDIGEARLERQSSMSYAEQVWEAAKKRAFTKIYLCAFCQLMPTTDFVVFCWRQEVEKQWAQSDKNKKTLRRL